MDILEVITYGHPILRHKADNVTDIDGNTQKIIDSMKMTLLHQKGIGLAAPQVGIPLRIFIVDFSALQEKRSVVLLNPKIVWKSEHTDEYTEGCLSIPDVWGKVIRPIAIRIKGELPNGRTVTIAAEGLFARALQHEIDHLDGKLFIDYLSEEDLANNQEKLESIIQKNRLKLGNIEL